LQEARANNFLQNVAGVLGTEERFRLGVVVSDVRVDGGDWIGNAGEDGTAYPRGGDVAEEAFDREMNETLH
jgi:hypothetical protein